MKARMAEPAEVEVLVEAESPLWQPVDRWRPLVARAAEGALSGSGLLPRRAAGPPIEISVLLTDDAGIRRLNARWRGRDRPTNVLAFPLLAPGEIAAQLAAAGPPVLLGDVVLAHETVAREASVAGIAMADHLAHLVVHGCLHLLGHDHEEEAEAERMERLETETLARLGIRHAGPRGTAGQGPAR